MLLILAAGAAILMVWGAVVWAISALGPPPPDPALANREARVASSPGGWITPDDYPIDARKLGETGRVAVTMVISPRGRVTGCAVTQSSGSANLDRTTCELLQRRGRYLPARDASGAAIEGKAALRFRWQLED
ncbi:energy transducer TonB [Sphingomonas sp. ST-64]|uniref:Energy transducer TonB n=1 Tax=Sphingomonas plantiphila TaxID=3163295 RepID=A0ABW8YQC0_9SPHN